MFDCTQLTRLCALVICLSMSNFSTGHVLCPKDELQCDTNKCISKLLRCDGEFHCEDRKDEINCDMNETTRNTTNGASSANETSTLSTLTSSITTQPLTHHPTKNKTTQSTPPTKRKSKKFKRKRVNFDNSTKRRTKRPYHYQKIPAWSAKLLSTVAVNTKPTPIITHCSAQECRKWRACWHDVKRSHKCACDEVTCSREWKGSAHARAGNDKDTSLTDVFEWVTISLSSTGLFFAIIVLLLKRRRLRHNNVRPLHVRTVVCYQNGQDDCARVVSGTAAEIRPLCEKARYSSLVARQEGSVCYIDYSGQVKGTDFRSMDQM